MPVERRGQAIRVIGNLVNRQREEPMVQWKAAAFARWHEPVTGDCQVTVL